jgi:hypothetical protein
LGWVVPDCPAVLSPVRLAVWRFRLSACRAVRQAGRRCRREPGRHADGFGPGKLPGDSSGLLWSDSLVRGVAGETPAEGVAESVRALYALALAARGRPLPTTARKGHGLDSNCAHWRPKCLVQGLGNGVKAGKPALGAYDPGKGCPCLTSTNR